MHSQSIVTKIVASACGVITVLLLVGSFVLIKFEKNMVETFSYELLEQSHHSIDAREQESRESLQKNIRFNTGIISEIGATYLFDGYAEAMRRSLRSYMNYPEIVAIQVSDEDGNPFAAAWKASEIEIGDTLPNTFSLNEYLFFQTDSLYDGEKVGSFRIFYTDAILTEKIGAAKKDALREAQIFHGALRSRLNRSIVNQRIGIVIILIVMIFCLIISLRALVLSPLSIISDMTHRLADFNLTATADIKKKDEIGMLILAINKMVLEFRKVVSDVKSGGKRLADASEQMTGNINTIASAAEEMSINVRDVSETASQMSQNVNAVAGAIDEVSTSINSVGENAHQGVRIAGKAVTMAEDAKNTMASLGEAAAQIGEVTEVIKRIADKTTLLALNADIEASSAGDAGRGFAAVANEIRAFARQSTRAAEDIAGRISLMQEHSTRAVAVIGDVSDVISNMNSSSEQIAFALEEQMRTVDGIASNALEADTRANNIAASVAQLAQGANEVSMNVGMAAKGKGGEEKDGDTSIRYMDALADEVARLAGELLELVGKFKVDL